MVEDYRKDYPVSVLCETLGVSLSGDSAWKKRPMSNHQREDNQLAEHIQEVYHSCRQVYGGPRIHAELLDQDFTTTCPDEKWTGDITVVWTIRGMALPGCRAGFVLTACNRMGDGGDPGRNAH